MKINKIYNPESYFYTELSELSDANMTDQNLTTDAFGPVKGSELTKYRTTSFVKGNNAKVFAIANGQLAILQQTGEPDKVNIIIKNADIYSPLKIKYFVYRGINKSDLIDANNNIVAKNTANQNQPEIISQLWDAYHNLNPGGTTIAANLLGYGAGTNEMHLDELFDKKINFSCLKGKSIGNFSGALGLDIILDYGDAIVTSDVFKLNLGYASSKDFLLDTSIPELNTAFKKKRYKEHIHQFLDAAAFWGSHINCGKIILKDNSEKQSADEVSPILKKYQTKDKIYVYIQGENNRSFNYYEDTRKVYGFNDAASEKNATHEWPILIKQLGTSASQTVNIQFDYKITETIYERIPERNISVDVIAPANNSNNKELLLYPVTERPQLTAEQFEHPPVDVEGKSSAVKINFFKDSGSSFCASFAFLYVRMFQKFPKENYLNDLWITNLKSSITVNPSDKMYWTGYDRNRNINLDDSIDETAIIQNRVVFDEGKDGKKRRLFIATIKNNTDQNKDYDDISIDKINFGSAKGHKTSKDYFVSLFGDKDLSIYKGTFGSPAINSLCLFHEKYPFQKYSYMLLGITEDEYNSFVLPSGADNVFFNLEEEPFVNENIRKFKLGIRYEDVTTGQISTTIYYPSVPIYVYSLDDLFFFSAEYSKYQRFYKELAPVKIEFKTIPRNPVPFLPVSKAYDGEFGFDWLRDADNVFQDFDTPTNTLPGPKLYDGLLNGYNRKSVSSGNMIYSDKDTAYKSLKREYYSLPFAGGAYSIPFLTLFSKDYRDKNAPVADELGFTPPDPSYEAVLRVNIKNPSAKQGIIKFEFSESDKFSLDKTSITSLQSNNTLRMNLSLKVTCLQDMTNQQLIKAMYYPKGGGEPLLAGVIVVNSNDSIARKPLNVLLTACSTSYDTVTSDFKNGEKEAFFKSFYQALIVPKIKYMSLSLQGDVRYTLGASGWFVYNVPINGINIVHLKPAGIFTDLKNRISGYDEKWLKIFAFSLPALSASAGKNLGGITEHIGVRTVVACKGRNNETLGHEGYHALGLYHTHDDTNPMIETDKKYTFIASGDPNNDPYQFKSTDNYMSYSTITNNIWNWQKKIVNRILSKDQN
ncbi:hypothetical protein [Chryseobacterium sp. JUb7]|uniref:hypothetical protein n=1 Tax=Chryseobacterium sp. JUb7 TaxID=2940599 RepID=UPI002167C260|nr:hypothetical protein [Chryseobacterium sp. JUb7]MCS3532836.1 hypothetical protein [Chryseobacterium sp. JUb7]